MEYSVSVYKDKKGALILIPTAFDKQGLRRSLDIFKKLEESYDAEVLGETLRQYFQISKNSPVIQDVKSIGSAFEMATGIKNWSKFSKDRICVGAGWNLEKGYRIVPMKRVKGGGYLSEKGDPVVELGLDSSDKEIGEGVIKAFSFLE